MNISMNIEAVKALTPQERVAGYVRRDAQLAELGAILRTKYKDVSTDYYEGWNDEEEAQWDAICDELDVWFYALNEEEIDFLYRKTRIIAGLGGLCRAEWPINVKVFDEK